MPAPGGDSDPANDVRGPAFPDSLNDGVAEEATKIAAQGAAVARGYGATDVTGVGLMGQPAAELIRESESAQLTVVGSRGHRPITSAVIGSVAYVVCAHAHSPVVVVRGDLNALDGGPVVVGYDGSAAAARAVDFAAQRAVDTDRELQVVAAWFADPGFGATLAVMHDFRDNLQREAKDSLHTEAVRIRAAHPGLTVTEVVRAGHPAGELIQQAEHASLLVAGTRGHGGFAGLLLGSVGHELLAAASCPVAVIR